MAFEFVWIEQLIHLDGEDDTVHTSAIVKVLIRSLLYYDNEDIHGPIR